MPDVEEKAKQRGPEILKRFKSEKDAINTKEAPEEVAEDITQYCDAIILQLAALGAALREVVQSRDRVVLELKKSQSRANVAELALTFIQQGGTIGKLAVEQAVARARGELRLDD